MSYRVDVAVRVEEALAELPDEGRQEVMETIAAVLVRPGVWPEPGGWDVALLFGPRSWVAFAAYLDGIDVVDVGWVG
ncbi:hypothetical protein OG742_37270 [Streptomyces sp. NBC_00828]|uniref:hypothetical protein n=1 Tax=Streptomyces sp. NBC_00828 TaxID=2903678 RepID=UPI00386B01EE